jgi:predicted acyltransferase
MQNRLLSIDVLRGMTLIFMIIVNTPGSWDYVYAPLLHADWNGLTPTDYIFPNFLFIVGVSIVLSLNNKINELNRTHVLKKIIWRAFKIYLVGVFLWVFPDFDFSSIRWVGVLQRISFVFLFCGLIYIFIDKKFFIYISFITLIIYWFIMLYVPVPGIGTPDLSSPELNIAHYIDSKFLPGVMWQDTWDPEGILTTIPSIITGVFGLVAGSILVSNKDIKDKIIKLFSLGLILVFLGDLFSWSFPVNKNLWSTSYTFLMAGMSFMLIAAFTYLIDVSGYKKFKISQVFGTNSIFTYVLSGTLTSIFYSDRFLGIELNTLFVDSSIGIGVSPKLASLIYAIIFVLIIYIPASYLFKKKIFIKL